MKVVKVVQVVVETTERVTEVVVLLAAGLYSVPLKLFRAWTVLLPRTNKLTC